MKPFAIPEHIRGDVVDSLIENSDHINTVEQALAYIHSNMSAKAVFERYCEWNGLLGSWGTRLWELVHILEKGENEHG